MQFSLWTILAILGLTIASPIPVATQERDLSERNTSLNEFLSILLEYLPDIDGTINDVTGILTTFETLLADLTGEQDTYNDLSSGTCKEYTVVFARGTTEPGNVGILVGPPFFEALKDTLGSGNVAIQGVNDYSADVDGYLEGGDPVGSQEMASEIQQAYSQCPNTKLVVSGYSQGCQLVHNAIALVPADVANWINSVVVFGDPDDDQAIPNVPESKVDTYCNVGDDICLDGDLILPAHLTYGLDAEAAAAFVAAQ